MKTEAFSGNIGKVSNLKVFIRELFSVYAGANWEATTSSQSSYQHMVLQHSCKFFLWGLPT